MSQLSFKNYEYTQKIFRFSFESNKLILIIFRRYDMNEIEL